MQKNVRYYDRNSLLSCILKHHRERRRCLNISLGATEVYSKSEYSLLQLLSDLKVGKSQSKFFIKIVQHAHTYYLFCWWDKTWTEPSLMLW